MTTGRITLETWLATTYAAGEGPTLNTARRWAKLKKLDPPAVKEGRNYYVDPDTRYTDAAKPTSRRLIDRVQRAAQAFRQEQGSAG